MVRMVLTDEQCSRIKPHCLGKPGDPGRSVTDIECSWNLFYGKHVQAVRGTRLAGDLWAAWNTEIQAV